MLVETGIVLLLQLLSPHPGNATPTSVYGLAVSKFVFSPSQPVQLYGGDHGLMKHKKEKGEGKKKKKKKRRKTIIR